MYKFYRNFQGAKTFLKQYTRVLSLTDKIVMGEHGNLREKERTMGTDWVCPQKRTFIFLWQFIVPQYLSLSSPMVKIKYTIVCKLPVCINVIHWLEVVNLHPLIQMWRLQYSLISSTIALCVLFSNFSSFFATSRFKSLKKLL